MAWNGFGAGSRDARVELVSAKTFGNTKPGTNFLATWVGVVIPTIVDEARFDR